MPQWIIEKKRGGHAPSDEEIRGFVNGYVAGTIPDYQRRLGPWLFSGAA